MTGDLVIAPFGLLQSAMKELKKLLAACRDREVWIMEVLPRFLIMHCCDIATHCANVRQERPAGTQACKKILTDKDLAELNALLAAHLTSPKVKMVATGDHLAGVKNASSSQLMDSMYNCWNQDPVHGEKVAYTRIGLGILDLIKKDSPREQRDSLCPKKRGREDDYSPVRYRPGVDNRSRGYDREQGRYRRDESTSSNRSGSSAYTVYPGDFDRRRAAPRTAAAAGAATTSSVVQRLPLSHEDLCGF